MLFDPVDPVQQRHQPVVPPAVGPQVEGVDEALPPPEGLLELLALHEGRVPGPGLPPGAVRSPEGVPEHLLIAVELAVIEDLHLLPA